MADTARVAAELTMAIARLRARLRLESGFSPPSAGPGVGAARGWTWSQLATLHRIIEHGPITVAALAQAEHVRPQSMAETVTALKVDDLVSAAPDPADGRKTLISATTHGHEVYDGVIATREEWLTQALDAVATAQERRLLADAVKVLHKLADAP